MKCPECDAKIEGILGVGEDAPVDGDLTICLDCIKPSIFAMDEEGIVSLRLPNNRRERFECELAIGALAEHASKALLEEDAKGFN